MKEINPKWSLSSPSLIGTLGSNLLLGERQVVDPGSGLGLPEQIVQSDNRWLWLFRKRRRWWKYFGAKSILGRNGDIIWGK